MSSRVNEISPVVVELEVEVPWEKVNSELENVYNKLQRTARIRGFRQGKIPRQVVRQLMGKSVKEEVRNTLVQEGIADAVKDHSLEPVAITSAEPSEVVDGKPLTLKAKIEVRPKIASVDTSAIQLERVSESVPEKAVDDEIEMLRQQNAELVAPEPMRPARERDVVLVDYKVSIGGKENPEMGATGRRLELGSGQLIEEFEKGLLGASLGEIKNITVRFPEDHAREELRGAEAQIEVNIKEVSEKKLPDVDDEFAKDLEYESLEAMKSAIRERLKAQAQRSAKARLREQLADKLIAKNPIEVPPSLVTQQEAAFMKDLLNFQQLLGNYAPLNDEIRKDLRARAERKVRLAFLLGQIARERKVEITEEQLEQRLQQLAESTGQHPAKLRANYGNRMREVLEAEMIEDKVLESLLAEATIVDRAQKPDAKPKEAAP